MLDTANGSGVSTAPDVLRRLGCELTAILGAEPDGLNINEGCGSTHLGSLADALVATGADLGIALDGDADRCLAVDHRGEVWTETSCWPCSPSTCGTGSASTAARWW